MISGDMQRMSLVAQQEESIAVGRLNPPTHHRKARAVQYRTQFLRIELPHHLCIDQLRRAQRYGDAESSQSHGLIHQAFEADLVPFRARIIFRSIPEIPRDEIAAVAAVEMIEHISRVRRLTASSTARM